MGRAPFQVLVILYRKENSTVKYCVFERKEPMFQMQFIAGGGEDSEKPLEAAKRELFEETGIVNNNLQQLISMCYMPTKIFSDIQRKIWGENLYVIPEYSFGAEVFFEEIKLSDEHIGYHWVSYDEALRLLKWDSNKTALYELHSKITYNN